MATRRHLGVSPRRRDADLSERLSGVRTVLDTRRGEDVRGIGYAEGDMLVTYHVTDDPERVVRFLRRRGRLMAAYGEKGRTAELGPGFYSSGNPDYWVARARNKWVFLKRLSSRDLERLLSALEREIDKDRAHRHLSEAEHERAVRDLRYVREGHYDPDVLISLAGQPYSIAFWKPEFLEPLGIRPGGQPGVVELRVRGRFAELTESYPPVSLLRTLRRAGLQGAFTRAGASTNPELVIWDPRAIVSARVETPTSGDQARPRRRRRMVGRRVRAYGRLRA